MSDFISTGFQELDEELGGGLPKGAITLFGGETRVSAKKLGRMVTDNISWHKKVRVINGKGNTFEGVATEVFHGVQEVDFLFLVNLGLAESPANSLDYLAQSYNQLFRSCSFEGKAILIHYGGNRLPIGVDLLASHRFDVTQDNNGDYLLQHTKNRVGVPGNYVKIPVKPKVVIPSRFNRKCLFDV